MLQRYRIKDEFEKEDEKEKTHFMLRKKKSGYANKTKRQKWIWTSWGNGKVISSNKMHVLDGQGFEHLGYKVKEKRR